MSSFFVRIGLFPSLARSIVSQSDYVFLRRYCTSRNFLRPNYVRVRPSVARLSLLSRSSTSAPESAAEATSSSNQPFSLEEIGPIPEPPAIPTPGTIEEMQKMIADNMREIGLASYATPVGWIQNLMDVLHSSTGLPWWQVIAISTVVVRTLTFPVMVLSQRGSSMMALHREPMAKITKRGQEAQQQGDTYEYQMAMGELREYMKEKGLPNPMKMLIPMLTNGFVFASYLMALRSMAKHSLFSLQNEGLLWFTDLTATDPTFLLPVLCAATTLAVIEFGVEFGTGTAQMSPTVRWFLRCSPIMVIMVGKIMPAAVLCYWFTNNTISLTISALFLIPKVRQVLKLPARPPRKPTTWSEKLAIPQWTKDLVKEPSLPFRKIRDWRRTRKLSSKAPSAVQIRRVDAKRFKAAGEGPMPPTFTFDPRTKYKEVFERKSFWQKLRESVRGEDKKKAIPKRAVG